MDKDLKAFADLDAEASEKLEGMALSRYKIEARRLFADVGSDKAKPILRGYISAWAKTWGALVKRNEGRALHPCEINALLTR